MERTILHCDLNNFYASVECRNDPTLYGRAVAVCGSVEDRHGIVVAANMKAKSTGVRVGLTAWEAKQCCPDIVLVPPHMDEYMKASKKVRAIYDDYSDKIEPFGLDECFIDVTGMGWTYSSGYDLAEIIRQRVKDETGLTISVGVSFNKVFAKLGSDMKKPDAVTVITPENFKEKIWNLRAGELIYIGRATEAKLNKYGIRTIGDTANADPRFLQNIFGKHGIDIWLNSNGKNSDPVMPGVWTPDIKSISHGMTCTEDLKCDEEVRQVMFFLTQEVSYKLRKHGLFAAGIQIDVKDSDRATRQYQCPVHIQTQSEKLIAYEAFRLFCKRYDWEKPVRAVTVRAMSLRREIPPLQTDLFFDMMRYEKAEKAEEAAMKVKEKFGKWSIFPASALITPKLPKGRYEDKVIFPESAVRFLNG